MKIVDGKIVEATENELFNYWLEREYDDIMSFPQFIKNIMQNNVIIISDN